MCSNAYSQTVITKQTGKKVNLIDWPYSSGYKEGGIEVIGWSNTGLMAYLQEFDNYQVGGIIGIKLVIFDAVSDQVVYEDYYDSITSTEEEKKTTIQNWNNTLEKNNIRERIIHFGKWLNVTPVNLFPHTLGKTSYDVWFDVTIEEDSEKNEWEERLIINWVLKAGNGLKTKNIANGKKTSRGFIGNGGGYVGSEVIGYYKSPHENRLVVVIAHYSSEFEGDIMQTIELHGFHLDIGFN
jgi:hypothetical protein